MSELYNPLWADILSTKYVNKYCCSKELTKVNTRRAQLEHRDWCFTARPASYPPIRYVV